MSAPAAIAVAKILIPETEKPKAMGSVTLEMEKKEASINEFLAYLKLQPYIQAGTLS